MAAAFFINCSLLLALAIELPDIVDCLLPFPLPGAPFAPDEVPATAEGDTDFSPLASLLAFELSAEREEDLSPLSLWLDLLLSDFQPGWKALASDLEELGLERLAARLARPLRGWEVLEPWASLELLVGGCKQTKNAEDWVLGCWWAAVNRKCRGTGSWLLEPWASLELLVGGCKQTKTQRTGFWAAVKRKCIGLGSGLLVGGCKQTESAEDWVLGCCNGHQ